jgi:hypothetical protein
MRPEGSGLVPRLPRFAWVVLGGDALSAFGSGRATVRAAPSGPEACGTELAGLSVRTLATEARRPCTGALAGRRRSDRRTALRGSAPAPAYSPFGGTFSVRVSPPSSLARSQVCA